MGNKNQGGSSALDIDGANNPTIGKRVLFFIKDSSGVVHKWPARILANFDSLKHAGNYVNEPNAEMPNGFCDQPPQGQVVYQLKVETANGDYVVLAYADSSRQAGCFDEYKEGDLRI